MTGKKIQIITIGAFSKSVLHCRGVFVARRIARRKKCCKYEYQLYKKFAG